MVSIPLTAFWSVRELADSDRDSAIAFLSRQPLLNIYLIGRIEDEGIAAIAPMIEVRHYGQPVCITTTGSNIVLAADPDADAETKSMALRIVGEKLLTQPIPVRAIISEVDLLEGLWSHIRRRLDPPTIVRLNQPVYAIAGRHEEFGELARVRRSTVADLPQLVPACAAMHREEVGIDPLERDAAGYHERVRELVIRKRSFVMVEDGRIAFKCELSAVTSWGAQIMGVWTDPSRRGEGLARAGMREVCGQLLREKEAVTLFVNDFNTPAIRLYESLGFHRIGSNRALIW